MQDEFDFFRNFIVNCAVRSMRQRKAVQTDEYEPNVASALKRLGQNLKTLDFVNQKLEEEVSEKHAEFTTSGAICTQ